MNDNMLLLTGIVVFGLMLIAMILTIVEFRNLPRRQKPEYDSVAEQARPRSRANPADRD